MKNILKIWKKLLGFLKKRWYIGIITLIVIGGIFYIVNLQNAGKKESTYTVKRQTLKETATYSGEIDADEKTTLRFQTPGKLAWVGVKEGDNVKKFQGIASLDQVELKKELQQELNTFSKSRLDLDQQQSDIRPVVIGALSKDKQESLIRTAQKAQYDVDNAVLDVELKDITLKLSFLSTPIAGVVTRTTSPYAGVNIAVKDAEFDIVNPETIYFSANVDQTDVVYLEEKMRGSIVLDAYPDNDLGGEIVSIAFTPKADETGTVYKVKLKFTDENDALKYRLGMTGDAEFVFREKPNVLAVPTVSIKSEEGKKYVFKKINNKKEKVFVKTGITIDTLTEITSGLSEDDVVYD